jgi:precorrin-2 dehydrogenase/sirohydrochlorin ferrochelatase
MIPLLISLSEKRCIIIGGGAIATRRMRALLKEKAQVSIVSPEVTPVIEEASKTSHVHWIQERYNETCMDGAFLVIAATNHSDLNRRIMQDAKRRGILCNDVSDAEEGDVIFPGYIQKNDLIISVSTQGASPSLAKEILHQMDSVYGEEYGALMTILRDVRNEIKLKIPDPKERKKTLNRLAKEDVLLEMIRKGRVEEARQTAFSCIW